MSIFQDANGLPIKFFIQKDISQHIQKELREMIAAMGGKVDSKVPRAGYVVVRPGTAEEERLRVCWNSPDRPERYFVPHTFVEACKKHGIVLKQIFIQDGKPVRMHIDSSIANINVRAALSERISHSGGDPTASAQSAKVILADPNTEVFQQLVKTYQSESDKYIESYLWVKKCVEKGEMTFTPVVYKNPGGRRAGEERTHFTEEDEANLCKWIAAKIPFKETGGRTGNRLYQQLLDMAQDPEYGWVSRHTWQSWRERYKKNAARLDTKIADIVERTKPTLGEKGQYGYVRKPEEKAKRPRRRPGSGADMVDGNIIAGPSADELEFMADPVLPTMPVPIAGPSSAQPPYVAPMYAPSMHSTLPRVGPPPPPPPTTYPDVPLPPEVIAARQNASEEEDDESEWQIRDGDGPTPAWAKRKHEYETEDVWSNKKPRSKSRSPVRVDAVISNENQSVPGPIEHRQSEGLHIVDQAVLEIARRYRFTLDEVMEYYDKCGDLNRTDARFKLMRDLLSKIPDDLPHAPLSIMEGSQLVSLSSTVQTSSAVA